MRRQRAILATLATALALTGALPACSGGDGDHRDAGGKASGSDAGSPDGGGDGGSARTDGRAGDGASRTPDGGGGGVVLKARSLKFGENLHAVWGSSVQDVWWVGDKGRVLHDNGCTLAPRDAGTDKDLYAVWGRGPDEVWFAGDGVLVQWDGARFTDRTPADLSAPVFRAIHAPADGSTLLIGGRDGVILRLLEDGTLHREATGSSLDIHALYAENAGLAWAVGTNGQALKLSGGAWATTTMPKASGTVRALAGGPADGQTRLLAVGDNNYVAITADGAWKAGVTNDPKNRDLHGVWALSGKEAWAVGPQGALVHYVGGKWNLADIDGTYMKTASLHGVFGVAGKAASKTFAYAVGDGGAGLRFSKGKWLDYRAETGAHLLSAHALADGRIVATGDAGLLLVAKDAHADFVDLGAAVTCASLRDATDDGAGGLIAVGDGGVVVHADQDNLTTVSVPTAAAGTNLLGVARQGGKTGAAVVAVGELGAVLAGDGTSWKTEDAGVQHTLRSVSGAEGVFWAVGDYGTVLRREKGQWHKESSGVGARLHRVVALAGGRAVAVGDAGVMIERGGDGKWKQVAEYPGLFLYGVAVGPKGTVVAVGWSGTLLVGKDGQYKRIDSGLPNVLRDVAITADGIVAVGQKGGVYQVYL